MESEILSKESVCFDEEKINKFILESIKSEISNKNEKERGFFFEQVIYNFLEYKHISFIETKKTRDFGLDGIIKAELEFFGKLDIGLQIKYSLIDSNDIDMFITSLKNVELQIGLIACKSSRRLEKYELNNKIKTILLSKGLEIEKLKEESININPILVLKLDEIVNIVSSEIRSAVRAIYKK